MIELGEALRSPTHTLQAGSNPKLPMPRDEDYMQMMRAFHIEVDI